MVDWMVYHGDNYMIQVPTNWVVTSSERFQAVFLLPGFSANVVIAVRRVQPGVSAVEFAQATRSQQEDEYPNYTLLEEGDFPVSEGNGYYQLYSWVQPEDNLSTLQRQAFLVVDDNQYLLTTTLTGDLPMQDNELDGIMLRICQSFTVMTQEAVQ